MARGAGAAGGGGEGATHRCSHDAGAVGYGWPGVTVRSYGSGGRSDGSGARDMRGRESGTRSKKRGMEVGWFGAVGESGGGVRVRGRGVGRHSCQSRSHAVDHVLKAGTVAQSV